MKDKTDLKEIFGVPEIIEEVNSEIVEVVEEGEILSPEVNSEIVKQDLELDNDYEFARQNIKKALDGSHELLESIAQVAKLSESPRAFEVASNAMKTIVEANKELIALHKQVNEIKSKQTASDKTFAKSGEGGVNVENAVFVGTSAELLKLVREGKGKHD